MKAFRGKSIRSFISLYCKNTDRYYSEFLEYLESKGHDVERLKKSVKDTLIKLFLSAEPSLAELKNDFPSSYNGYVVWGVDLMLDEDMNLFLIEININPGMFTKGEKFEILRDDLAPDILFLGGYQLPPTLSEKAKVTASKLFVSFIRFLSIYSKLNL